MSSYDLAYLKKKAEDLGFIRDTLEKVYRLADILEYFNTEPFLRDSLALKGGTAINLTIFNLPRLSVDIDLDYLLPQTKDEMLQHREILNTIIDRFMAASGYAQSPKSKKPHSLDSWIYQYVNAGGNRDIIKIEINYSLRSHLFPAEERSIITEHFASDYRVKTLAPIEIFGSKINALLSRGAARDLYDVGNMVRYGLFDESEHDLLKKSIVFYAAISSRTINKNFAASAIDALNSHKIKRDLYPVIRKRDTFNFETTKMEVKLFLRDLLTLSEPETEFLQLFEKKEYRPELLFNQEEMVARIIEHPMALWKMRHSP